MIVIPEKQNGSQGVSSENDNYLAPDRRSTRRCGGGRGKLSTKRGETLITDDGRKKSGQHCRAQFSRLSQRFLELYPLTCAPDFSALRAWPIAQTVCAVRD